ncbi:archease [Chlamydiota bacterium]
MNEFEFLSHTADIGIKAYGASIDELFSHAAKGMFRIITTTEKIKRVFTRNVTVQGIDYEDLLVRWLTELVYISSVEKLVFSEFMVTIISENRVKAQIHGDSFNETVYPLGSEIKGVAYHGLKITQTKKGLWQAIVFFDI